MFTLRIGLRSLVLLFAIVSLAVPAGAADIKTLVKEANAKFRAIDNTNDDAQAKALFEEAKSLLDQIAAQNPNAPELMILKTKSRRAATRFETSAPPAPPVASAPKAPPAPPTASPPKATPGPTEPVQPASGPARDEVIKDWAAFVQLHADFTQKVNRSFPQPGVIVYEKKNADQVLALIDDLAKNDVPRIKQALKAFGDKYGTEVNIIDRKLFALTPLDNRYGMYDEQNRRPDGSAGQCYTDLVRILSYLGDAPKIEAKRLMKLTVDNILVDMDFFTDTTRDARYADAEADLQLALRFSPEDEDIKTLLAKTKQARKQSGAEIEKALDTAKFPESIKDFAGPGHPRELVAATLTYFNKAYPAEKALAASICGNWISAKHDLVGQTIQWGLPVYVASAQKGSTDVVRVFRMTVLGAQGSGAPKAPPFTDHWTGDSFRMRAKNLPPN